MNDKSKPVERVIGLDTHPDTFTAAIVRGPTPAAAIVEKTFNKVPIAQLLSWAQKYTTAYCPTIRVWLGISRESGCFIPVFVVRSRRRTRRRTDKI